MPFLIKIKIYGSEDKTKAVVSCYNHSFCSFSRKRAFAQQEFGYVSIMDLCPIGKGE
jgi:hypothetical protein